MRGSSLEGMAVVVPILCFILTGCSAHDGLFPLRTGEQWTYTVKNSFATRVQQVKVTRRVPVALTTGYELQGPMGISRLAWRDGTLYAEALPNTRLYRPLPILIGKSPNANASWSGDVQTAAGTAKASATLTQAPDSVMIGVKNMNAVKAVLVVKLPAKVIEVDTWYVDGIGPVKQDQRTNGDLDVHTEWLSGP